MFPIKTNNSCGIDCDNTSQTVSTENQTDVSEPSVLNPQCILDGLVAEYNKNLTLDVAKNYHIVEAAIWEGVGLLLAEKPVKDLENVFLPLQYIACLMSIQDGNKKESAYVDLESYLKDLREINQKKYHLLLLSGCLQLGEYYYLRKENEAASEYVIGFFELAEENVERVLTASDFLLRILKMVLILLSRLTTQYRDDFMKLQSKYDDDFFMSRQRKVITRQEMSGLPNEFIKQERNLRENFETRTRFINSAVTWFERLCAENKFAITANGFYFEDLFTHEISRRYELYEEIEISVNKRVSSAIQFIKSLDLPKPVQAKEESLESSSPPAVIPPKTKIKRVYPDRKEILEGKRLEILCYNSKLIRVLLYLAEFRCNHFKVIEALDAIKDALNLIDDYTTRWPTPLNGLKLKLVEFGSKKTDVFQCYIRILKTIKEELCKFDEEYRNKLYQTLKVLITEVRQQKAKNTEEKFSELLNETEKLILTILTNMFNHIFPMSCAQRLARLNAPPPPSYYVNILLSLCKNS